MSRDLSHEVRELLVLARGDAPTPKARDDMWDGLERAILPATAAGIGTAAAATKPVTQVATNPAAWKPVAAAVGKPVAAAPASATWLSAAAVAKVAIGGLIAGTAIAVSAVYGLRDKVAPQLAEQVDTRPAVAYSPNVIELDPPSFPATFVGTAAPSAPVEVEKPAPIALAPAARAPIAKAKRAPSGDDGLLREASLVGEARSALIRGEPEAALTAVRAARREGKNLEPEELSIEARTLRALGREGEAAQLDATLRTRYPSHALTPPPGGATRQTP